MKMTGNTLLITGGGSGIGRGLAEAFHRAGNQIVIAGRDVSRLREVASAHPGMAYLALDQRSPDGVAAFVQQLTARFPTLNGVINNAGIQRREKVTERDWQTVQETISTNLLGPIYLTTALLPHLLQQPRAAILNVTSELAFMPQAATPTYCASKAALHSYTQSLRFQLRDTAVQVIEVIPPWVQTGLQGEQGHDPRAMPLDVFINETMALLQANPESEEIVVARARPLRDAPRSEGYDALLQAFNSPEAE
ncbi:oxidoreductase [Lonsdalea britannica]|uniref:Oxidoreductase n=1 Tax=Lonsdalea britannica TaxID=1082704 RepID=A0AAD0SFC4_9GAMM|nr:SDR family NAD(P)-dependent oxidoreductase [Lonsdalea britannica]AXW86822.1 oxidoreductase [Lonsdalea britannica]OSM95130.1 oxidoreductase [Lonsdalea britannica]